MVGHMGKKTTTQKVSTLRKYYGKITSVTIKEGRGMAPFGPPGFTSGWLAQILCLIGCMLVEWLFFGWLTVCVVDRMVGD